MSRMVPVKVQPTPARILGFYYVVSLFKPTFPDGNGMTPRAIHLATVLTSSEELASCFETNLVSNTSAILFHLFLTKHGYHSNKSA